MPQSPLLPNLAMNLQVCVSSCLLLRSVRNLSRQQLGSLQERSGRNTT